MSTYNNQNDLISVELPRRDWEAIIQGHEEDMVKYWKLKKENPKQEYTYSSLANQTYVRIHLIKEALDKK